VFELGRVFLRDAGVADGPLEVAGLRQPLRIAGAAYGPALEEQWGSALRRADLFDVKADLDALFAPQAPRYEAATHPAFHPARSARVLIGGRDAGWVGELHPQWQQKYELAQGVVCFEIDVEALLGTPLPQPSVPSKFPPVTRDIALVVSADIQTQSLLDAITGEIPAIVQDVKVFDLYQGPSLAPGTKSLAFRVVMQDTERTLTDAEADAARDALVALWGRRFAATLRT